VLRRLASFFRKPDYRVNSYAHPDLSHETKLAWHARLKLLLSARRGLDHSAETPAAWVRWRKWILLLLALLAAWVLAETLVAWNFYEG
jgi:Ca2+/H+ antiporter